MRKHTTHVSWQSKQLYRVSEMLRRYGKPVLIDECRYEGNLPEFWGNLSGQDMVRSFWRVTAQGGYCTHGETYLPGTEMGDRATATGEEDVVWWAKGGRLNGESPARIAFLRQIVSELPGPLEPLDDGLGKIFGLSDAEFGEVLRQMPAEASLLYGAITAMDQRERDFFFSVEFSYSGHCGDEAYLYYKDDQCCACAELMLPEDGAYRVEVIDTWEMTRETVLRGAKGKVSVNMPGKPYLAVLALRE